MAVHCPLGVGTIMDSYMIKEAHRTCRNQGDGHDDEVELMYCSPCAKCVCLDHILHFVVHFPIECGQLCFFFYFASTSGHRSRPDPRCGKRGEGV